VSRTLTTAVGNAALADHVVVLALVELDFSSGVVRMTNSGYDVVYGGYTWSGKGAAASMEEIKEPSDLYAAGVALRLSGIPSAMVTTATSEDYQGRSAKIWLAFCSADHVIQADPVLLWVGRMDVMTVEMGAEASITLTTESRFADWDRPRVRRYNDADQQAVYAGDTGLRYMEQLVEKQLVWGAPGSAIPANPQTGGGLPYNPYNPNNTPPSAPQTSTPYNPYNPNNSGGGASPSNGNPYQPR
jgi:hypothetical protein